MYEAFLQVVVFNFEWIVQRRYTPNSKHTLAISHLHQKAGQFNSANKEDFVVSQETQTWDCEGDAYLIRFDFRASTTQTSVAYSGTVL